MLRDVVPRSRAGRLALVTLILIATVLRVSRFLENRPLWTDEAKLALSIGRLSVSGLFGPLDYNQVAPILYLCVLKLATSIFGMHEWVLRLPALIAGVLMVAVVWLVGRRVLSEFGALIVVALAATAPLLVAYSAEAKPYELDAFVSSILLLFALRACERDDKWRRVALGFAGVAAIGFSLSAILILGGIGVTLVISASRRRDWISALTMCAWGVIWVAAFLFERHLVYTGQNTDAVMQNFWRGVMIRIGEPGWMGRLVVSLRSAMLASMDPGLRGLRYFAPIVISLGSLVIWKRSGPVPAVMLLLSLGVALLASALSLLPIDGRLALFFTPVAFLWIAAVADYMWNASSQRPVIRTAIVSFGIVGAAFNIRHPSPFPPLEASRDLIASLSPRRAMAPIYLFSLGVPGWLFYSTDWRHPDLARLAWYAQIEPRRNAPSRGHAVNENEPALEWRGTDGLELVGRFTGMQFVMGRGWTTSAPDPNWGNAEMKRLASRTSDTAWVYGSHLPASQVESLREGLRLNGGEIVSEQRGETAVLWRVRFRSASQRAR
jgi:4-amino-4-deoxy-L-arabinose transferase-like glycosyltransferase